MNRLAAILLATLAILFSCKKSNNSAPALTGIWYWNATYNDGAPGPKNPLTPVNSGIIQKLSFTNKDWNLTQNGVIVSKGSYSTFAPGIFLGNITEIRYTLANNTDSITYYTISSDSLIFSHDYSGTVGSGATFYTRQ